MIFDVIIIGKGPAGLSASLYTTRGNLSTLIIGSDSELLKAHVIENYCFIPRATGKEMIEKGIQQARDFGAKVVEEEVIGIKQLDNTFIVSTNQNSYVARSIILATGKSKIQVPIKNLDIFEGKGIHYCVACDGYFYNGSSVGILGYTDYAIHELKEFEGITTNITLYTNGNELVVNEESKKYLSDNKIKINTSPILSVDGGDFLEFVEFKSGEQEKIEGLFVAYGTASSTDFARNLGVLVESNNIIVNKEQETDISGVFAAGNCTGGFAQVSTAVGEGANAGQSIKKYLRTIKQ
ncbi:NAD(P)/FAD-dependent oxidoreductase [Alkalibaculum sp. M08DMB]|uniref:NAD(P)/FAD-dependent oxidoreductase n=2 Tax=Alkalibaculum sporogenes TaxID=2655001 RepID=A0A6A7K9K6_9FIRM|nr:NAD(P)/FAD-dependent oxidoreductase [Alkalibaculum sporogenes]